MKVIYLENENKTTILEILKIQNREIYENIQKTFFENVQVYIFLYDKNNEKIDENKILYFLKLKNILMIINLIIVFVIIENKDDILEYEKANDNIFKQSTNILNTKNIIYEQIPTIDDSKKIQEFFQNIALKCNEININKNIKVLLNNYKNRFCIDIRKYDFYPEIKSQNLSSITDSNESEINKSEKLEKYTKYLFQQDKSYINTTGLSDEEKEDENLSESEPIIIRECGSDSYSHSNGSFNNYHNYHLFFLVFYKKVQ